MDKKLIKEVLVLAAVVSGLLLPFINKPFNVDDPFYLKAAEQFAKDPLRPYSYSINWSGELRDAWQKTEATFPPLVTAYTALVVKVFGEKEWALHLCFMIFPLAAALAMYFIAKKYTTKPLFPALLFSASPAFLVSSTSIMLDVPLCALMLSSVAVFIYGVDKDNGPQLLLGSVIAGLAILAKYSGAIVIPVILCYLFVSKKMKYAGYAAVPVIIFGLWCAHNLAVYESIHFIKAAGHIGKGLSLHKLFAFGAFFGGALVFPVFLMAAVSLKDVKALVLWLMTLFVFGYLTLGSAQPALLFSVFCAATVYFLYRTAFEWINLDRFLTLWLALGLAAVVIPEPWVAARYLIILIPPAAIIFAKIVESLSKNTAGLIMYGSVAVAAAVGVSVASADYAWAKAYGDFAQYVKSKQYNSGSFVGHFGFQYYLEKIGMTALEVNKPLTEDGYVIAAKIPDPQKPSEQALERMQLIEVKPLESGWPVRLMDPGSRAGFYSSYWGILPYSVSSKPLDITAIYKITKTKRNVK